jgi:N-glycosidase YbiA
MKYNIDPKDIRIYNSHNSCIFKKNSDEFGSMSNMATKYPLNINGIKIRTSETLYQLCRFPMEPEVQQKIIDQKSPMTVKMISRANVYKSRKDWDYVKVKVMKWCISVKLAQNFITFGEELSKTGFNYIVENSAKDNFWGAIPNNDGTIYIGKNGLGRLLMQLRQEYYSENRYDLLIVEPLNIPDFYLLGKPILVIDERKSFVDYLLKRWYAICLDEYVADEKSRYSNTIIDENPRRDESLEKPIRKPKGNRKLKSKTVKVKTLKNNSDHSKLSLF